MTVTDLRATPGKLLISGVILGVLGLQAAQSLVVPVLPRGGWIGALRGHLQPPALYPFVDYPMYSRVWRPGDALIEPWLFAVLADGSERRVRSADLGVSYWLFLAEVVTPLERGEREEPWRLLAALAGGQEIARVRLERRRVLWEDGVVGYGSPESVLELEPASGSPGGP